MNPNPLEANFNIWLNLYEPKCLILFWMFYHELYLLRVVSSYTGLTSCHGVATEVQASHCTGLWRKWQLVPTVGPHNVQTHCTQHWHWTLLSTLWHLQQWWILDTWDLWPCHCNVWCLSYELKWSVCELWQLMAQSSIINYKMVYYWAWSTNH